MVRVWGLVKGYTPIKVNLPESGRVKVNIRTALLNPAGKTIIGTLHLNGTTVYVGQDRNITIGSSSLCDIRIKDPAVKPVHTMIESIGGVSAKGINATVQHLFQDSKTGVLTSAQETRTITDSDEPLPLGNGDIVFLPLSGKELLPIGFKLRQTLAESIRSTLTNELSPASQATTDIHSLEKALAKIALADARSVAKRKGAEAYAKVKMTDPLNVRGTSFKGAKDLKQLFEMYFRMKLWASIKDRAQDVLDAIPFVTPFMSMYGPNLDETLDKILIGHDLDLCAHALQQMSAKRRRDIIKHFNEYKVSYPTLRAIASRISI